MPSKPDIPVAVTGDKRINMDDYNAMITSVNKYQKQSDTDSWDDDGLNRSAQPDYTPKDDFPFRIQDMTGDIISITEGDWIRDQTSVTLEEGGIAEKDIFDEGHLLIDILNFTNVGAAAPLVAGQDYYVYVQLESNAAANAWNADSLYDPALIPGKLQVYVDLDANTAGARGADYVFNNAGNIFARDLWVKDKEVIGTVSLAQNGIGDFYIKEIKQKMHTDIEDYQVVADSMGKAAYDDIAQTIPSHQRFTLEVNKIIDPNYNGTIHFGEYQLSNVDECPGFNSYTAPYFYSLETNNNVVGPSGILKWASYDAHYYPVGVDGHAPCIKTIDVIEDVNYHNNTEVDYFEIITLNNVTSTVSSSYSMPYYASTSNTAGGITQGALEWSALDTHLSGVGFQESLEVSTNAGGTSITQLYGFRTAPTCSMASDDRVIIRDADGGNGGASVRYVNAATLGYWVQLYDPGWSTNVGSVVSTWWAANAKHYDLIDIVPGTYTKHDHKNYWQNVDSTAGRVGAASWDYLVNNATSIGDASKKLAIHLDDSLLYFNNAGSDTKTLDWENGYLWDAQATQKKSLEWIEKRRLYDASEVTSVRWHSRWLYDSSGKDSISWGSRVLYDANENGVLNYNSLILNEADGTTVLDWENQYLYNSNGSRVMDWDDQQLENGAGSTSLDWQLKRAYGTNSDTIDWGSCLLKDDSVGGAVTAETIRWKTRYLSHNNNNVLYWSNVGVDVQTGDYYHSGTQVVTSRQATVADPAGGATVDAEARTAINAIIDRLQAHGLIS